MNRQEWCVDFAIQQMAWAVAKAIIESDYTVPEVASRLGWHVRRLRRKLNTPKSMKIGDAGQIMWACDREMRFGLKERGSLDAGWRWERPRIHPVYHHSNDNRCMTSAIAIDLAVYGLRRAA